MKKNRFFLFTLTGGLTLLTAACVEEKMTDDYLRPVGSEIIFSAATSYENFERTRTVYTGKDENNLDVSTGSNIERIDWENDDRVTIVYAKQSTTGVEYKVTGIQTGTPDYEDSYADVEATGTKLVWQGGQAQDVFYALYPTQTGGNHPNGDASLGGSAGKTVSGKIPSTQTLGTLSGGKYLPDMKYAYMAGYADASNIEGNRVTLPFTPAVTAFEFIFKAASALTVMEFELESTSSGSVGTALTGNFSFDITGGKKRNGVGPIIGAEWGTVNTSNTGKSIKVSFGSSGKALAANETLDFTVFALPVQQKGLTLRFTLKNGATTYTKVLPLKDQGSSTNWHPFAACKKHIITNDELAGDNVVYTFDVTFNDGSTLFTTAAGGGSQNYKVTSYATIGGTKTVPIPWEAYSYSVKDGNDAWTDWSGTKPACLSTFTASGTPSASTPTTAQSFSSTLAASTSQSATNALKNAAAKGTQASPYDLSTHTYAGGDMSKTTANCYIVTSPGWYKFPLAYGNAYQGGATNTNAYAPTSSSYGLSPFRNHSGTISGPDISGASTATLLWQDAKDLITLSSVAVSSGFVVFEIKQSTIQQGNAVIAVKNSGGTVLWSWHIWVTPFVNNVTSGTNNVSIRGKTFMSRNLGWCDSSGTLQRARRVKVRFRQPGANSGYKELTYIQNEASVEGNQGSGPYYQWGRKDPMIPADPSASSATPANKKWYNANNTSGSTTQRDLKGPNGTGSTVFVIDTGIKNPDAIIWCETGTLPKSSDNRTFIDWIGKNDKYLSSGHYCNLWNYNITTDHSTLTLLTVNTFKSYSHGKTVYDPCPVGYTVPLPTEISALATSAAEGRLGGYALYNGSETLTWDNNKKGYKASVSGNYIRADGFRKYFASSRAIDQFHVYGFYHSSAYCNLMIPLNLYFNNSMSVMTANYGKAAGLSVRCVPE